MDFYRNSFIKKFINQNKTLAFQLRFFKTLIWFSEILWILLKNDRKIKKEIKSKFTRKIKRKKLKWL